jgi:hypothetical protein
LVVAVVKVEKVPQQTARQMMVDQVAVVHIIQVAKTTMDFLLAPQHFLKVMKVV